MADPTANLLVTSDVTQMDPTAIHEMLKDAYWCPGIPLEVVRKAMQYSLCFGIIVDRRQVGYARVVTDRTGFAWICDVIVHSDFRGRGYGKLLMAEIMKHPELQGLRRMCLATRDAHDLYRQFGFQVTATPQNWMEIKNNEIYLARN